MQHPHFHRTLVSLALLGTGFTAQATDETMTVVGKRSQHQEVATATRTNTPAKLVPQTIDSVKVSELTAFGQPTLSEALVGIPGVDASGDTRFDGVTIRGFSAGTDFYLDGFRDDMQYTRDLGNIERVEVLKGPAAVLYGRGSSGGIINRISKKPQKGQESSVTVRVGSYDYQRMAADLSAEPSEAVQLRLNVAQEDNDSFRNGVHGRRTMVAPAMNWDITDRLSWLLQYERNESHRTPDRGIPGLNGRPADVPRDAVYSDLRRDYINDLAQSARSRFTWDVNDDWQVRQQLSLIDLSSQFDNTYITKMKGEQITRTRFQQDLQTRNLASSLEVEGHLQSGPIAHTLLVGTDQGWQERYPKLWQSPELKSFNLYNPEALPTYDGKMSPYSDKRSKVRSAGTYVQDQLTLGDWQLLLGLRYDHFEVNSRDNIKSSEETITNSALSPRAGLVWSPVEEHALYVSYSKSFMPNGGALIGLNEVGNKNNNLDPEFTRQYETGVKSDWLDGHLATTLSFYRLEMYNKRRTDPNDNKTVLLTGLQRTDGIELSTRAQLNDEVYLRGGIALQDAEMVEDSINKGNRPSSVSRLNGELFAGYQQGKLGWFGESGVTAVGDRFADNANTTVLPGYARVDARAGYRWQHWEAQFGMENLFDTHYYVSATGASQIMPGSPRQVNLTTSYRF
ncbi:TonB-dependent siderophore receptor [Aeromonas jandaei]|uniref:TonB-dependent receptor n=1 Tax=Aeromonas jandaei TaxID=650 RepID=UPI00191EAACD|nr:TonB-dependent siderophore receptor [Aeromonas jandaei]MBL0599312.1 TonB-dependent siderophore receptor [Aeromonas jandaei]